MAVNWRALAAAVLVGAAAYGALEVDRIVTGKLLRRAGVWPPEPTPRPPDGGIPGDADPAAPYGVTLTADGLAYDPHADGLEARAS